jgi:hypothetical protein
MMPPLDAGVAGADITAPAQGQVLSLMSPGLLPDGCLRIFPADQRREARVGKLFLLRPVASGE